MVKSEYLKHSLVCPTCFSELTNHENEILCDSCGNVGNIIDGVLNFTPVNKLKNQPAFYDDHYYKEGILKVKQAHKNHYNPNSITGKLESYFKNELLKIVVNPQRPFFDIGCGTGTGFKHLGYPEEIIGIDISLELAQTCKSSFPQADCICCNIENPPFKQGSLKTIFSIEMLHQIFYLENFLESIEYLLSDDGYFYVLIPTEGGISWNILRNIAHVQYSRNLKINYKKFMEKDACNTAYAVENALNKFFIIDLERKIPWRIGGNNFNLTRLFRLKKRAGSTADIS